MDLTEQILDKCRRENWYGSDEFRSELYGQKRLTADFWCTPATKGQIKVTEEMLGFSLPMSLVSLYTRLANGGFGPAIGLRGLLGGYGTQYTALPNGGTFFSEETLTKYRYEECLVSPNDYEWQQQGQSRVMLLPSGSWPKGLLPLCDWGDCVEVCVDSSGHLFYWGISEHEEYELHDMENSLEQWLYQWAKRV